MIGYLAVQKTEPAKVVKVFLNKMGGKDRKEAINQKSPKIVTFEQLLEEEPEFEIFQKIKAGIITPVNKFTGQEIPCFPDNHEYMHTGKRKIDDLNLKMTHIGTARMWLERQGNLDELVILSSA